MAKVSRKSALVEERKIPEINAPRGKYMGGSGVTNKPNPWRGKGILVTPIGLTVEEEVEIATSVKL